MFIKHKQKLLLCGQANVLHVPYRHVPFSCAPNTSHNHVLKFKVAVTMSRGDRCSKCGCGSCSGHVRLGNIVLSNVLIRWGILEI